MCEWFFLIFADNGTSRNGAGNTNLSMANMANDDSNAATYSEADFGDSNQTETFDRVEYKGQEGNQQPPQTDFSSMVKAEAEGKLNAGAFNSAASASRKRKANGSPGENSRKRSK